MLCYAMLAGYAMLCYAMLCYAMLCYAMLGFDVNARDYLDGVNYAELQELLAGGEVDTTASYGPPSRYLPSHVGVASS